MQPARNVFIAAQAITPFIGKGNPDFIDKAHPDFGKRENPSLEGHLVGAVNALLEGQGVDPALIERGFVGNFAGELFSNQGHLGAMVARADSRLAGVPFARMEAACASGGVSIVSAVESIQAGLDVVLVVGADVGRQAIEQRCADRLVLGDGQFIRWINEVDEVIPESVARRCIRLGGSDVHASIHLPRVDRDDLGAHVAGEGLGEP